MAAERTLMAGFAQVELFTVHGPDGVALEYHMPLVLQRTRRGPGGKENGRLRLCGSITERTWADNISDNQIR